MSQGPGLQHDEVSGPAPQDAEAVAERVERLLGWLEDDGWNGDAPVSVGKETQPEQSGEITFADLRALLAERDALLADKARLDWIQERYVATDFDYMINDESACVLVIDVPHDTECGADFRKTIDAARTAGHGRGE